LGGAVAQWFCVSVGGGVMGWWVNGWCPWSSAPASATRTLLYLYSNDSQRQSSTQKLEGKGWTKPTGLLDLWFYILKSFLVHFYINYITILKQLNINSL